jgi:hypothetical protein
VFLPLLEVTIEDSAGETFPADPDALQHTITPELVDNQEVLHQTCNENVLKVPEIFSKPLSLQGLGLPGVLDSLGIKQRTK